MGETCEVCGLELASVETRNLLHAGELVRYGEYRGKCVRDASCLQRGYEREKARADAATAKAEQYERDWYDAKSEFGTAMAKSSAALAAARRDLDLWQQIAGDLYAPLEERGFKCEPRMDGSHVSVCGTFDSGNCPLCMTAALAAPAAGEEGKR